jgi:hypothetical protein
MSSESNMSYYLRTMTPSAFESALRQKDGELASYMSRLVCICILLIFPLKLFSSSFSTLKFYHLFRSGK